MGMVTTAIGQGLMLGGNIRNIIGQGQGLAGVQQSLNRQMREQDNLSKGMDSRTQSLVNRTPAGLIRPEAQPYSAAVGSRLAALGQAMPGMAGMRMPGSSSVLSRLAGARNRADMDARAHADQGAAQGAEEARARQLGELDFQRRMLAQQAQDRAKLYQQEQDTGALQGISNRNVGNLVADIGRSLTQSGGIF